MLLNHQVCPVWKTCGRCGKRKPAGTFGIARAGGICPVRRSICRACSAPRYKTLEEVSPSNYYKANFGMTKAEFVQAKSAKLVEQDGVCKICGSPPTMTFGSVQLLMDHCHETGVVRGLLCTSCNVGLGSFRDDPSRLRMAAEYVESYRTE